MNRIAYKFAGPAQHIVAATALLTCIAFAGPSHAAWSDVAQAPTAGTLSTPMVLADATPNEKQAGVAHAHKRAHTHKQYASETVETRINDLHADLKITSAQESQWKDVAQVMRDNADKLNTLVKARSENAKTMTAVDDLKSYAAIAEEHEDGTKKLIPVFQSLYDSLSDDQKKAADTEFREHGHHHHKH
jgi:hypothetical protein